MNEMALKILTALLGSGALATVIIYCIKTAKEERNSRLSILNELIQDILHINSLIAGTFLEYKTYIFNQDPLKSIAVSYFKQTPPPPPQQLKTQETITKITGNINIYFPEITKPFHSFYALEVKAQLLSDFFFANNFDSVKCAAQWGNYEKTTLELKEKTDVLIQAIIQQSEITRNTPLISPRKWPIIKNLLNIFAIISKGTLGSNLKRLWKWSVYQ